jgi:predicted nucleotidyltransferase
METSRMAKPLSRSECREVTYDAERWALLHRLRNRAIPIMEALRRAHLESIVHGSVARGDVKPKSDVDIFVPLQTSSFSVEETLEKAGITVNKRLLVQATPTYTMKAHIEIDDSTAVSFPLMNMRRVEREFYKFGAEASLETLLSNSRVLGVDKRLMLIMPTEKGHTESSIIGQEELAAKMLRISVQTVLDRTRTLLRRDRVGRTGVFIKNEISEDETFEMVLHRLAEQNPAVRRRLQTSF